MNDFDKYINKANNLKNRLEKEIKDINNLFDKTIDDITKSFNNKIEQLTKEENDMKDRLKNKVTKIKEKLEIFLDKDRNEIKISENIKKGIEKLEKEKKNMIIVLSYVSKINKNKKRMNELFREFMKSLKFDYKENENVLKLDEYYFNGAPIPYNIEYKDNTFIGFNDIELNWKIDDIKLFGKNKIKFKIDIKKEKEEFNQIYEGTNNNYIIKNLENNNKYEIRICSSYNNVNSSWSESLKITTRNSIDSKILSNSSKKNEYLKKIYEWSEYKSMKLLYRGTKDGMFSKNFHEKCDDKGPTITLFRNDKGNIFGGYLPISWKSQGEYINEERCFIFTLSNIYNIQPTKFESLKNGKDVYFNTGHGPCFYDIWNYDDLINKTEAFFGDHYKDTYGKGNSMFTGNKIEDGKKITLNEVEVFKLYK